MSSGVHGLRNNNPGNLRDSRPWWNGQVGVDEAGFCIFADADHGLRALAKNLMAAQVRHGCKTVAEIVARHAPNNENDTATYVGWVATHLYVRADDAIDVHDPMTLWRLVETITRYENGAMPYSAPQIDLAVAAALQG
jgi:hypothetical protein